MNKRIRVFVAGVLCFALALAGQANAACVVRANVYFINGVNKPSEDEVAKTAEFLAKRVQRFSAQANSIQLVTYLYNDSDGLMLDTLYELAAKKAVERNAIVSEMVVSVGMAAFGMVSPLSETDQQSVRLRVAEIITSALPTKTQAMVSDFSQRVATESLNSGTQAVLVPHSQGNMFANAVYDTLKLTLPANISRGLGVVNIANPAARAPSSLYLTASQDRVINLLATSQAVLGMTFTPMTPNYNASAAALQTDPWGHGFVEVYLSQTLPTGTTPVNSIASAVIGKVDTAMIKTSTFYDTPNFYYDANGLKQPKPPGSPVDSSVVEVCFPAPIGGI